MYNPVGVRDENYIWALYTKGGDISISINNTITNGNISKSRIVIDNFEGFSDYVSSTEEGDINHPPLINVKSDNETFINAEPNMDDPSVILNRLRAKKLYFKSFKNRKA